MVQMAVRSALKWAILAKVVAILGRRKIPGLRSETWATPISSGGFGSVAEVADTGEDHGDAEAVGGGDDVRVFD